MSSDVEISNMALNHIGVDKSIASLTENSKEARLCLRWFEKTKKLVLRDRKWPFATQFAALSLVEEDPTIEYAFSYRYPSDCLEMRRILNGIPIGFLGDAPSYGGWSLLSNYYDQNKVPYKIGQDSEGQLIYCSLDDAQVEYTKLITNNQAWPIDFEIAMSYRLAAFIAPALTAGDPNGFGQTALEMYDLELNKAAANGYNEEQAAMSNDSALTRVRE